MLITELCTKDQSESFFETNVRNRVATTISLVKHEAIFLGYYVVSSRCLI